MPAALQASLSGTSFCCPWPCSFCPLTSSPAHTHTQGRTSLHQRGRSRSHHHLRPVLSPPGSQLSLFLVVLVVTFLTLKGQVVALFLEVSALASVYGLPARLEKSAYSPESPFNGRGFIYIFFS